MNLVTCSEQCIHQNDGYCNLNDFNATSLSTANRCAYFKHSVKGKKALAGSTDIQHQNEPYIP